MTFEFKETEMDGEGKQLSIILPGFTCLLSSPSWLEKYQCLVWGLASGSQRYNAIVSCDRAISCDNTITDTVLVLAHSYRVESRNQRLRKSVPPYLNMPAIAR